MLTRIALHQTRLSTPGLGLDAKGVALGAKGLVLLPTLDRLVSFLAIYTREHSLAPLLASMEIRRVRSRLGTQELTLTFAAESSDRMDRVADTARLVGAFTFTGAGRHFVQYRDAAGPFGYDATDLLPTDAPIALYHDRFSQAYEETKEIDLRALLLRLIPSPDPADGRGLGTAGPYVVVAEEGLGPALMHFLVRSRIEGEVTVAEWPPSSAFDDVPLRRFVVRIPEAPSRVRPLLRSTPGITTFEPAGAGVAVEVGFRHPVQLRACPVFDENGLVLIRGRGDEPLILPRLPVFADLRSFARVELLGKDAPFGAIPPTATTATVCKEPDAVRVGLRLVASNAHWRAVTATWIPLDKIPLLRRLAYALAPTTLRDTRIALTDRGAFLTCARGVDAIPLGTYFSEAHPDVYLPAGLDVVPRVAPEVLHRALGSPHGLALFVMHDATTIAVSRDDFVALETAVLEARPWDVATAETIVSALAEGTVDLKLEPVGLFPLADVPALSRLSPDPEELARGKT